MGSSDTIDVRIVSSAWTRLPGSTMRRLSRPEIGAVTLANSWLSLARSRFALAIPTAAPASA